jgi:hypothetical protein
MRRKTFLTVVLALTFALLTTQPLKANAGNYDNWCNGQITTDPDRNAEFLGDVEAGWLNVGSLKNTFERMAFVNKVQINILMSSGLLKRRADFRVIGTHARVLGFCNHFAEWINANSR